MLRSQSREKREQKKKTQGQKKEIPSPTLTSSTPRCFSEHAICVTTSSGDRHPEAMSAPTPDAPGVARRTLAAGVSAAAEVEFEAEEEGEVTLLLESGLTWPK